jgi:hypothetical protein
LQQLVPVFIKALIKIDVCSQHNDCGSKQARNTWCECGVKVCVQYHTRSKCIKCTIAESWAAGPCLRIFMCTKQSANTVAVTVEWLLLTRPHLPDEVASPGKSGWLPTHVSVCETLATLLGRPHTDVCGLQSTGARTRDPLMQGERLVPWFACRSSSTCCTTQCPQSCVPTGGAKSCMQVITCLSNSNYSGHHAETNVTKNGP